MIRMENVYRTGSGKNSCSSSRREILAWVNKSLDVNVERLEDLCSGAEYCRLLHKLRPSAINLKKVLMSTKAQRGFIHNMKLLQKSLLSQGVKKQIPIYRLVDGGYRENLEFAQWFKSFYDHNYLLLKDENVQEKKDGVIVLVKPRNISQMRKSSDKKEPMKKANEILENISENTNAEQHFTESDDSTESSEDSARTRREQHSCSYANGASRKPNARSRMRGSYSKQTSGTSTELSDISSVGSNDSSVGSNDSSDFTSNSEENGRRSRNSNGYSRMLEESQSDSSGHSIELESYCGCRTCEKGRKIAKQRTIPLTRFRLREFFGSGNSSPILKCSRQRVPNVFQIGAWILEVPVQQFSDRPRRKAKIFKSLFVKEAIKWKCNALKGAQMNVSSPNAETNSTPLINNSSKDLFPQQLSLNETIEKLMGVLFNGIELNLSASTSKGVTTKKKTEVLSTLKKYLSFKVMKSLTNNKQWESETSPKWDKTELADSVGSKCNLIGKVEDNSATEELPLNQEAVPLLEEIILTPDMNKIDFGLGVVDIPSTTDNGSSKSASECPISPLLTGRCVSAEEAKNNLVDWKDHHLETPSLKIPESNLQSSQTANDKYSLQTIPKSFMKVEVLPLPEDSSAKAKNLKPKEVSLVKTEIPFVSVVDTKEPSKQDQSYFLKAPGLTKECPALLITENSEIQSSEHSNENRTKRRCQNSKWEIKTVPRSREENLPILLSISKDFAKKNMVETVKMFNDPFIEHCKKLHCKLNIVQSKIMDLRSRFQEYQQLHKTDLVGLAAIKGDVGKKEPLNSNLHSENFGKVWGEKFYKKTSKKNDRRPGYGGVQKRKRSLKSKIKPWKYWTRQGKVPSMSDSVKDDQWNKDNNKENLDQAIALNTSSKSMNKDFSSDDQWDNANTENLDQSIALVIKAIRNKIDTIQSIGGKVAFYRNKINRIKFLCTHVPGTNSNDIINILREEEEILPDLSVEYI